MKREGLHTKPIIRRVYILALYIVIAFALVFLPIKGWCQETVSQARLKQDENITAEGSEKIIARVGEATISADDLKEYLSYRPLTPPSTITREALDQRLNEMITGEALYQEALRQNLHQDPRVRRIIYQTLNQKLLKEKVESPIRNSPVTEEELQAYYEKHKYIFDRPEQVRLADIFIAVDQKDTFGQRAKKKKKAKSILAEALKKGKRRTDFGALIRKYSDKHPKYSLGDTGYFDAKGKPVGLNIKLAKGAFKLKNIGAVYDHVIKTPEGYHVIMLVEKRSAFHKPLNEVKSQIERKIRRQKLEETRKTFINQVKENVDIQRDDQAISELLKKIKEKSIKKSLRKINQSLPQPYDMPRPPTFPKAGD